MNYFCCILHEINNMFKIFVLTFFHSTQIHEHMNSNDEKFFDDEKNKQFDKNEIWIHKIFFFEQKHYIELLTTTLFTFWTFQIILSRFTFHFEFNFIAYIACFTIYEIQCSIKNLDAKSIVIENRRNVQMWQKRFEWHENCNKQKKKK